jgi:hypothetical protein
LVVSGFPKILWNSDVTGALTWAWNDGVPRSVALTDYTHDTVLELAAHLQVRIRTIDAAATVGISQIGICTVTIPTIVALNWAGTSNELSTRLGFDESEALSGTSVISSSQHERGYYPGLVSYGYYADRGAGLTAPLCWEPDYHEVRVVAGNMVTRAVATVTPQETCELSCGLIKCDTRVGANEWADATYGTRAWHDACVTLPFRLYPNRYLGTVAAPGTPATGEYYNCAMAGPLRRRDGPHPSYCSWSVPINRETSP